MSLLARAPALTHTCHWPGCTIAVEPRYWGCRVHWFALPAVLRARIWSAYRPGQEITKDPSPRYMAAAHAVQRWIAEQGNAQLPLGP